jgi:hypothetical protein
MRFSVHLQQGYLRAELVGRETADEMREFLHAVQTACRQHGCPKILMTVRTSRAIFKPEDYGLSSYVHELVSPACQIALVGDSSELNAAHEYIEVVARQKNINTRAFRDEPSALRWLRGSPEPARRYRFTRIVLLGAPADAGIYALWDEDELVYYGRAMGGKGGGAATIRSQLLDHLDGKLALPAPNVTHYSWEICADPVGREAELINEHQRIFGRPPRFNSG